MSSYKPFNSNVPRPDVTWTESWSTKEQPNSVFSLRYSVLKRNLAFILKTFKVENGVSADLKEPPTGLPYFFIQSINSRAVQRCYAILQQEAVKADTHTLAEPVGAVVSTFDREWPSL